MKKKLKFLYVSHSLEDVGGAEISLKTLANQLKKNGHSVVYASLGKYSDFKTYVFKRFSPFYTQELYERYLSKFLQKVIRKEKPDIIHANDRFVIIPSVIAAKKEKIASVVHFRDFSLLSTIGLPYSPKYGFFDSFDYKTIFKIVPFKRLFWELYKYFYIKRKYPVINQADAKISISKAIKEWTDKQGIKDSIVVNNPINVKVPKKTISRKILRKKWNIPDNATVVLFLGGFSIGKGIDTVLKVIEKATALKKDFYFMLVGAGNQEKEIKELSEKNKKVIYVKKLPAQEIYKPYTVSDMVLLPSKFEPFSRIVIESMYMRKPVISSNTGGGKEAIVNGESGFLVPPEDIDEWLKAIAKLAGNKKLIKKFKSHFKEIVNRYSSENAYKNFLEVYRNILKK